jgi:IMP cyclohydrolase
MVYTGRLVVVGKSNGSPFVGFLLASRSLPYRKMELIDNNLQKKVVVFPQEGHEEDNLLYPEVDNYSCLIASEIPVIKKPPIYKKTIVGFNGNMCKRCVGNLKDGMNPFLALDSTLFEFRGAPGDARIGGIVQVFDGCEEAYLGVNDVDSRDKRIKGFSLENNKGFYTCCKNTSLENSVALPSLSSPEELARHIATKMIPGIDCVSATSVLMLREGNFDFGKYASS